MPLHAYNLIEKYSPKTGYEISNESLRSEVEIIAYGTRQVCLVAALNALVDSMTTLFELGNITRITYCHPDIKKTAIAEDRKDNE